MRVLYSVILLSCAIMALPASAQALTFAVTVTETSEGVEAVGEGAFDTSQLAFSLGVVAPRSAALGEFFFRVDAEGAYWTWVVAPGADPFASDFLVTSDDADFSGDPAGFTIGDSSARVLTPVDYVSGDFLSNRVLFEGEDLASFGATPGVYVKLYGDDDEIVVTVVDPAPPAPDPAAEVPLPAGLGLLGIGLAALGALRRSGRGGGAR
ncbi:MAG: hypothetical protein AAF676_09890 [Pseudomonadota bacterium]